MLTTSCSIGSMSWRSRWDRVLGFLAVAVLVADLAVAAPAPRFPTPEAAVLHLVKRLMAEDLDGALQAFRIDEAPDRIDAALREQTKDSSAPAKYRTVARVAQINVVAQRASDIRRFIYALLLDGTEDRLTNASDANIDRFIRAVNPARIKGMRIVRIDQPMPSTTNRPEAIQLAKSQAVKLGADERTERIALFQLDGRYYRAGFTLLRSNASWRIAQLESIYGDIGPSDPPARQTTVEEYEALTR